MTLVYVVKNSQKKSAMVRGKARWTQAKSAGKQPVRLLPPIFRDGTPAHQRENAQVQIYFHFRKSKGSHSLWPGGSTASFWQEKRGFARTFRKASVWERDLRLRTRKKTRKGKTIIQIYISRRKRLIEARPNSQRKLQNKMGKMKFLILP